MPPGVDIVTPRLWLRRWKPEDLDPFAAMNSDPDVMEHFPSMLSRQETAAAVGRVEKHFEDRGYGFWAVEAPGQAPFIGFIGLAVVSFDTSFTPCVEIGWRLTPPWWGKGLATEGARAALAYGFERLGLEEIVAFTVPGNTRSRRVMQKLGMRHSEDFDHPCIDPSDKLCRHVLYRLSRAEWASEHS